MNLLDFICSQVRALTDCHELSRGVVLVNTQCLYPNRGAVQALVTEFSGGFIISDDGGAVREVETSGASLRKSDINKHLHIVSDQGLKYDKGVISVSVGSIDAVATSVQIVANASKELADAMFRSWRVKHDRDFKKLVKQMLKEEFHLSPKEESLVGQSNKPHKFENVVYLENGIRAVIDPVLHDPNSMNSRVVANMDVQAVGDNKVQQHLIYDDTMNSWSASDLNVLRFAGVPMIAFSKAPQALRKRLLAAA